MNDLKDTNFIEKEKKAMGKSIKLEKLLVPVGLKHQVELAISEYQAQQRTDPNYIEALYEAVALPPPFYESNYRDDEAIDWEASTTYLANLDQLVEVYKDQSAVPKMLVNQLFTSFADVVLKSKRDGSEYIAEDASVEMFVNKFYERIGKLTGSNGSEESSR
jgi:hypothetical protein